MLQTKGKRAARAAALEILPSQLRLSIVQQPTDDTFAVQTASHPWRVQAASLADDDGRLELAVALRQLASQYRLANTPVQVALSGDYCVTRVVSGLNDEVRRELADLEQRSYLYLSLGHGPKAAASCVCPIDARHQRAMLAVVNDRVLSAITDALQRANLQASVVEPSLVSLCRLVGELRADQDSPALVVHATEHGVEVGISHGGNLLLDYRPAAREARETAGAIIGSHLHRLQRYCDRYVRLGGGKLKTVLVSGEPELVKMVQRGLGDAGGLEVKPLSPAALDPRWKLSDSASPEYAPTLGAALLGFSSGDRRLHPNLLDRSLSHARTALLPSLARTLWPVAATLAIAATGWGFVQFKRGQVSALEMELATLEPQQSAARQMRAVMMANQQEVTELKRLKANIHTPSWSELAARISQCLPEDVWLDDVRLDAQGRLQLVGASFTEDGVFEFVRHLEQFPDLQHVALSGTRPTRLTIGAATQFDVRCNFAGASGQRNLNNDNG